MAPFSIKCKQGMTYTMPTAVCFENFTSNCSELLREPLEEPPETQPTLQSALVCAIYW